MTDQTSDTRKHNADLLRVALFARCKTLWGLGLLSKLCVFALGALIVLWPEHRRILAILAILVTVASECLQWWSDIWKGAAQKLHRKVDFEDSFGWPIDNHDLADALAKFPGQLDRFCSVVPKRYFASAEPPGIKRAL